jgi:hypothetical protein
MLNIVSAKACYDQNMLTKKGQKKKKNRQTKDKVENEGKQNKT